MSNFKEKISRLIDITPAKKYIVILILLLSPHRMTILQLPAFEYDRNSTLNSKLSQ